MRIGTASITRSKTATAEAIFWRAIAVSVIRARTTSLDPRSKGRPGTVALARTNRSTFSVDSRAGFGMSRGRPRLSYIISISEERVMSACGPKQTFVFASRMSAFRGKADIIGRKADITVSNVSLRPHSKKAKPTRSLLAQSGLAAHGADCPLLEVKRTSRLRREMSAHDPKRKSRRRWHV